MARWVLLIVAALTLPAGAYLWAKAEYYPADVVDRAQAFITLLEAGQMDQAQAMAMSNEYMGRTPEEFADRMWAQRCRVDRVEWTSPPQTNGNRLRRWWRGVDIEMPEVAVEFEGDCLLLVSMRRGADGQWRVFNIQRHAG